MKSGMRNLPKSKRVLGFPLPASALRVSGVVGQPRALATARPAAGAMRVGKLVGSIWRASVFASFAAGSRAESDRGRRRAIRAIADLWERRARVSGIDDRDYLLKAALTTFIRREAAKGLIALGGTMPEFTVPPRERPNF